MSPLLAGRFLTIGPPGKSLMVFLKHKRFFIFVDSSLSSTSYIACAFVGIFKDALPIPGHERFTLFSSKHLI